MNAFLHLVDWDELADRYNADFNFEDEAEEEMEDA
jgi:hypothetical protein